MFTSLFKGLGDRSLDKYFGNLGLSLYTLFEFMTFYWVGVTTEMMEEKWWAWMPVVDFIVFSSFIVYNIIVTIICDAISVMHDLKDDDDDDSDDCECDVTFVW